MRCAPCAASTARSRSDEDANRTQLYATERRRTELLSSVGSLDDWIRDLAIVVRADTLGPGNLPRAAQLLNKTNQMNLTTRRMTEDELLAWASEPGHATWCVTVADRLGDAGLTGLVSVAVDGDDARLVDFVLSCRVMGRRVEPAMLHLASTLGRELGARRLVATYAPDGEERPVPALLRPRRPGRRRPRRLRLGPRRGVPGARRPHDRVAGHRVAGGRRLTWSVAGAA